MNLERRRVLITGRVQNVWYRDSCRNEAVARDVRGWVRICSAGTVEAVFEGSAEAVAQMISWCRKGPPRAQVESVDVIEEPVQNEVGFFVL